MLRGVAGGFCGLCGCAATLAGSECDSGSCCASTVILSPHPGSRVWLFMQHQEPIVVRCDAGVRAITQPSNIEMHRIALLQ
jgi:hypothetical protein